eukprot:4815327-Heterocapsa_arctica.AAC.1
MIGSARPHRDPVFAVEGGHHVGDAHLRLDDPCGPSSSLGAGALAPPPGLDLPLRPAVRPHRDEDSVLLENRVADAGSLTDH